jgi:PIN domain nuclease of toxin-antitoxin system
VLLVLVLDTHALFWLFLDSKRLSRPAKQAIAEARVSVGIAISDITLWELASLAERRRIQISGSVERFISEISAGVAVRPITPEIAAVAARLPSTYPRDPADRLIGSTAVVEGAFLVTADQRIRDSQVIPTIW